MTFTNTSVYNFENAIRGARNPMNSWHMGDSKFDLNGFPSPLGDKDLRLLQSLLKAGDDSHSKFMRQILVSVDIDAPLFLWSELDTYKIGTTANSCSTMHKLAVTNITSRCFEPCTNFIINTIIPELKRLQEEYNQSNGDTEIFQMLKGTLPSSWIQKRTWTANYAVIRNIVKQRKNHKLKQWNTDFMNWVHNLPYAEELIFYNV